MYYYMFESMLCYYTTYCCENCVLALEDFTFRLQPESYREFVSIQCYTDESIQLFYFSAMIRPVLKQGYAYFSFLLQRLVLY